jgi:hypothetical protein
MDDTNPQGSVKTVRDAAGAFLGMMEPTEPQGQPEAPQEPEYEAQAEYEDSPEEVEAGEEVQEEPQQTPKYRVKVDNDEVEVDVDELIKGYSRTSDYTRKTQQLAEQRKVIEAEKAKIDEASKLRDQYAQRLQVIEQVLAQSPQEDMAALKETDPIGYAVKMAEQVEREKQLAAVRQERAQLAQRQYAEQQERLKLHIAREAELLKEKLPDYADETKGAVLRHEIKEYAKSSGYTEQDLNSVYDHKAIVHLYKSMMYDRLIKSKPATAKRVAEAPKTLRPGTTQQSDPKQDVVKKLKGQLRKTGKQRDAAKLFERFL